MRPYKTAHTEAKTERIINRSRFISQCFPVRSEDEALSRLNEVRKQYPDATHVCYAYRIGEPSETTRFSDAGEPSGTAGMPILEVLKANELTYVLCTVTRYFGGILLGAGGLVRAYSEGAKIALAAAEIKVMAQSADLLLRCGYDFFGKLEYYLNEHGVLVLSTEFGEEVAVSVRIRKEDVPSFEHDITELSAGKLSPLLISEGWNEM